MKQLDLYRNDPRAEARAYRLAAETARLNPFETPEAAERRAQYYEAQAALLEQQVAA